MQYDVFISYSRKDSEIANRICDAFDKAGITYFIDRQGINGGLEFPVVLADAIINSQIFLFLASKNSYESKFTQAEITFAFNKKSKDCILPYIIDGSTMPSSLEFVFSAINWRNIEEHPIDPILLDDLLGLMERQKSKQVELKIDRKRKNWKIFIISSVCITLLLLIIGTRMGSKSPAGVVATGHEYVDLGLSVNWATCNIGASIPEEYGDFYLWGDTSVIPTFSTDEEFYDYFQSNDISTSVENEKLRVEYDAASKLWGGRWRMPTAEECLELLEKCEWKKSKINNINGYTITGPNGNRIFLPAAGMAPELNIGEGGYYWTSSAMIQGDNTLPTIMIFYGMNKSVAPLYQMGGTIRPVID